MPVFFDFSDDFIMGFHDVICDPGSILDTLGGKKPADHGHQHIAMGRGERLFVLGGGAIAVLVRRIIAGCNPVQAYILCQSHAGNANKARFRLRHTPAVQLLGNDACDFGCVLLAIK